MFRTELSRSGNLFAEANNVRIHSAYDPINEVKKYLQNCNFSNTSVLLLLGPGLGYLLKEIQSRYPGLTIIVFLFSSKFIEYYKSSEVPIWHPQSKYQLSNFLRSTISEWDIDSLRLLEWEPSARAFPDTSYFVNKEINQFVKEYNGNMMVTARNGSLWLRNLFRNFLKLQNCVNPDKIEKPVIIAASGPSLKESLPFLKKYRKKYILWALPSSLLFLFEEGILPDLTIATDPGFYAACNLMSLSRFSSVPTALPLTSASLPTFKESEILLLSQSSYFENALFNRLKLPYLSVAHHGTVAGTALYLCRHFSVQNVILAGLDLCFSDIHEHVQPHFFYRLFISRSDRLNPFYSVRSMRTYELAPKIISGTRCRYTLPLETYAGSFSRTNTTQEMNIYRLNPSPVLITNFTDISHSELASLLVESSSDAPNKIFFTRHPVPTLGEKQKILLDILFSWEKQIKHQRSIFNREGMSVEMFLSNPIFNLAYLLQLPKLQKIMKSIKKNQFNSQANKHLCKEMFDSIYIMIERNKRRINATRR